MQIQIGLIFLVLAGSAIAQDQTAANNWPQWRGPNADGVAHDATPVLEWSATKNVKWKTPIPGTGSATPIIWGDRIFVATAEPTSEAAPNPAAKQEYQIPPPPKNLHRFALLCIDRKTGKVVWDKTAIKAAPHEGHHKTHTFAAASPVTNGTHVFVSFGSRGIFAFDFEGNKVWERDVGDMQTRRGWGEGASPALHNDTLIVNWDHEGSSFIVALDAKTGDEKWKVERDEPTSWATPLIVGDGKNVQVVISATNQITSYDIANGDVLWTCDGLSINCVPSPVTQDGVVFCMSNYRQSAAIAIPLKSRGDVRANKQIVWQHEGGTPYCPSPLLYEGRLYFTASNRAIMTVLDAKTGQRTCDPFRMTSIRSLYGSPVAAGGHIFLTGREGKTVVMTAGPKPEIIGTNDLGEPVDASPVIIGSELFIRGRSHLYGIGKN